jgi:hypothetical protein
MEYPFSVMAKHVRNAETKRRRKKEAGMRRVYSTRIPNAGFPVRNLFPLSVKARLAESWLLQPAALPHRSDRVRPEAFRRPCLSA